MTIVYHLLMKVLCYEVLVTEIALGEQQFNAEFKTHEKIPPQALTIALIL